MGLALLLLLAGCAPTNSGRVTTTTVTASDDATGQEPARGLEGPPSDVVEVIEAGFGLVDGDYTDPFYTYAVILENANGGTAWYATDIDVTLTLRDSSGTVVGREEGEVAVLLPGQRAAVTGRTFELAGDVDSMDVQTRVADWVEADTVDFGSLEVTSVNLGEDALFGEVSSTFDRAVLNAEAAAVFYDDAGRIIGGWEYSDIDFIPAGGTASFEIHVPQALGPSTAEAYVQWGWMTSFEE